MLSRLAARALTSGAILAVVIASGAAQACGGKTELFRDDFTKVNRAWAKPSNFKTEFVIGGGKMLAKNAEGEWGKITYGAKLFAEADVCVDVVVPQVDDPTDKWAGILFEGPDGNYIVAIGFDGTIGVHVSGPDGWLEPIPHSDFDGVKTEAKAVNRVRVVWKGPPPKGSTAPADSTVTVYVNDKMFETFDVAPNSNRKIGFGFQTESSGVEFRNLVVTK